MAEAKIDFKVGAFSFSAEGTEKWLASELSRLLDKVPQLTDIAPPDNEDATLSGGDRQDKSSGAAPHGNKIKGTLAAFLKEKSATTNQVRKFLATAVYLQNNGNGERLSSVDVTNALSENKQGALKNPSLCLIRNVKKGFCQPDGKKQFYVTPEGIQELL